MRKDILKRNTNLISRNIANLKEKYKSISIEILRPERADLVDKCPAFDLFLKRLDVFMHTLYSKFRYMITISSLYPKMTSFITRLGFREGALCSHQHLSSIVPPKTRILGPQIGDLLLTLSDTCMLYIFRKLSSASTSLTKN